MRSAPFRGSARFLPYFRQQGAVAVVKWSENLNLRLPVSCSDCAQNRGGGGGEEQYENTTVNAPENAINEGKGEMQPQTDCRRFLSGPRRRFLSRSEGRASLSGFGSSGWRRGLLTNRSAGTVAEKSQEVVK